MRTWAESATEPGTRNEDCGSMAPRGQGRRPWPASSRLDEERRRLRDREEGRRHRPPRVRRSAGPARRRPPHRGLLHEGRARIGHADRRRTSSPRMRPAPPRRPSPSRPPARATGTSCCGPTRRRGSASPGSPGRVGILGDAEFADGTPVTITPRAILRRQAQRLEVAGYAGTVGSEPQFTLVAAEPLPAGNHLAARSAVVEPRPAPHPPLARRDTRPDRGDHRPPGSRALRGDASSRRTSSPPATARSSPGAP